jgi:protein required for attachment to host cells
MTMILPHGATVAVTDGTKMLLFRNKGKEAIDLEPLAHPRLDHGHAGSGGRHRSSGANPDAHRIEEDDFAAAASAYLNKEVLAGNIVSIAIIANARTLGEMRKHFHSRLVERLAGEVVKDLVDHSKKDIEAAVRAA